MRWSGHGERVGDTRGAYRVLVGKAEGKNPLRRLRVDLKVILKWIFKK
jgi:hypothetical protein